MRNHATTSAALAVSAALGEAGADMAAVQEWCSQDVGDVGGQA